MSIFERYLTVWVGLCVVAGIALGHLLPGLFRTIAALEIARVNLPVAALIWLMGADAVAHSTSRGRPSNTVRP